MSSDTLPPTLAATIEQARRGELSHDEAVSKVRAWPASLPAEMATKVCALRILATIGPGHGTGSEATP
jgi:hypothetical protein